jgi:5'-3' exonuclease
MALLMLLDGNSLTYRAFFALPTDLATASGQVTNAVYGFTSMLVNLIKDHKPDYLAVAFDRPEPTFRHELVEGYKATRSAAPDILRQQMGLVRQLVETMRVPVVEAPGYEADDVLATLATRAAAEGNDVIVVTGDRDTYQLVEDPHLKVLYNRRGVSDYALYDEAGILERTGVTPAQYPDFASLRGDPSDNLPGVPGVGEKTAAKLITTYGDLDGVYAHLATARLSRRRRRLRAQQCPGHTTGARPRRVPRAGRGGRRGLGRGRAAAAVRVPRVPHLVGPLRRRHRYGEGRCRCRARDRRAVVGGRRALGGAGGGRRCPRGVGQ